MRQDLAADLFLELSDLNLEGNPQHVCNAQREVSSMLLICQLQQSYKMTINVCHVNRLRDQVINGGF